MKYKHLLLLILCVIIMTGCSFAGTSDRSDISDETEVSRLVEAMDTIMSIKAYGADAETALDKSEEEIMRLDALLRRKSENSEIYKLNNENSAKISDDTFQLIKRALDICENTNGAFDITIAPVMDLWGFYDNDFYVPTENELNKILSAVDYHNIEINNNSVDVVNGANIDLGGIAKGYTSNRIAEIFRENNVKSGIVSLGGNVQAIGVKPDGSKWKVAIQHPDNESYIGGLSISDMAVITSGGYQRFFERNGIIYHHIIDPSTGYPAHSELKSVSIVSADATLADGLSTALFVMGLDAGIDYWQNHNGFDVVFVTDNNKIYITKGIEECFESQYEYTVIN